MVAPKGNTYNNKYKPEYVEQVYKLCLLNAIDRELADFFEVSVDTIRNWSIRHPEFDAAKRAGKMKADAEVASKLFSRAIGCSVKKQRVLNNGSVVDYYEELPPDTRAIEYWLQCRNHDKWNSKQQVELSGNQENPLAFLLAEVATEAENTSPLPMGINRTLDN